MLLPAETYCKPPNPNTPGAFVALEDTCRAGRHPRRSKVPARTVNESFFPSTFPIFVLPLGIPLFKKAPMRGAAVPSGTQKLQKAASYYQRRWV